jgi:hypothetical protein
VFSKAILRYEYKELGGMVTVHAWHTRYPRQYRANNNNGYRCLWENSMERQSISFEMHMYNTDRKKFKRL